MKRVVAPADRPFKEVAYKAGVDTGYTAICPICDARYAEKRKFSGICRTLEVALCEGCYSKKLKYQKSIKAEAL